MNNILYCEIMDTFKSRAQGLQHVLSLPWNSGALFIYEQDQTNEFWMKNTPIPLDLIFMDENYNVIDIHKMNPHDTTRIACDTAYRYALEVNQGWCEAHDVTPGKNLNDIVTFEFI